MFLNLGENMFFTPKSLKRKFFKNVKPSVSSESRRVCYLLSWSFKEMQCKVFEKSARLMWRTNKQKNPKCRAPPHAANNIIILNKLYGAM